MANNNLENIYNYRKISNFIATSGQPTEEQFYAIKNAGYEVVVNLALSESPRAIPQEQAIVELQGMKYVHIPIIWDKPTLENIEDFFNVMQENADKSVFVHCAANMRVSAFMYLYRRIHQGISEEQAVRDLHQLWVPNDIWQAFIEQVMEHYHFQ